MKITTSEIILVLCLFVAVFWGNSINQNSPGNILALQDSTKIVNKRGDKVVVVFSSGPKFNTEDEWVYFTDKELFNNLDKELAKDDYTYVVLNTTCLAHSASQTGCSETFSNIALAIADLKPEAVVYTGLNSGTSSNSFQEILISHNIPIFVVGTEIGIDYDVYLGPNNKELGKQAYEGIKELIEPGQEALYVETVRISGSDDALDNGYPRINSIRTLLEKDGVETRVTLFTLWNEKQTYNEVKENLIRYGPVDYLITPSAETASGSYQAVSELGYLDEVKIISLDFTPETYNLLKEDKIYGVVSQSFGKQAKLLAKIIKEPTYTKGAKLGFTSKLITKDNLSEFLDSEGKIVY